jgi:hypothetical protein
LDCVFLLFLFFYLFMLVLVLMLIPGPFALCPLLPRPYLSS